MRVALSCNYAVLQRLASWLRLSSTVGAGTMRSGDLHNCTQFDVVLEGRAKLVTYVSLCFALHNCCTHGM